MEEVTCGTTPLILDVTGAHRGEELTRAAQAISEGECIVLPTDTVYGIGADALNPVAVAALLAAKERGRDMPPPVLISDPAVLAALCEHVPRAAQDLAEAYWPGGLTLVLRAQESLTMDLGETAGTIAVRVPDDDAARELLRMTGPMAVSSANKSGRPAALTAQDAADQLGTEVAVYLDGGPTRVGTPSTIIDFASTEKGRILRQGALSLDEIHTVAPEVIGSTDSAGDDDPGREDHEDHDVPAEENVPSSEQAASQESPPEHHDCQDRPGHA